MSTDFLQRKIYINKEYASTIAVTKASNIVSLHTYSYLFVYFQTSFLTLYFINHFLSSEKPVSLPYSKAVQDHYCRKYAMSGLFFHNFSKKVIVLEFNHGRHAESGMSAVTFNVPVYFCLILQHILSCNILPVPIYVVLLFGDFKSG